MLRLVHVHVDHCKNIYKDHHCVINRFQIKLSAQEMRVVPKHYLNNPLQVVFDKNLKHFPKKYLVACRYS